MNRLLADIFDSYLPDDVHAGLNRIEGGNRRSAVGETVGIIAQFKMVEVEGELWCLSQEHVLAILTA